MYNFTVMHRNEPVAQVWISDDHMNVRIEKIVPDSLIRPFGGNMTAKNLSGRMSDGENDKLYLISGSYGHGVRQQHRYSKKYYDRGCWYKQNRVGYEGRAEYLASKVLACSNINEYVEREPASRALEVLHIQLQKYESILKDDSLVVG